MKEIFNQYIFPVLLGFIIYQFFIQNRAEADARPSYEKLVAGQAIFIDVREENEVKDGMVKGAVWIPLSAIEKDKNQAFAKIKELAKNSKEIYLYCRSGNRSGKVKAYLEEAGIKATNLGGYSSLVGDKLPTQPGPQ